jgi:hypothetical protein
MRLICPNCQKPVTIPDTTGGPTPCPNCNQPITPPALTGAAIDAAPAPPPPTPIRAGSVSDGLRQGPSMTLPAPTSPTASTGKPWLHLTLRREVAHWLAPGALIVALILSFFTWDAVAPNGNRIYTQIGWQAGFGGGFTTDLVGERVMKAETELNAHRGSNIWLIFYLLLLLVAVAVAVADRVLSRQATVPDIISTVWPHREMILAGLCVALVIFLIAPLLGKFGLESSAAAAAEAAAPLPQPAAGQPEPTTAERAERDLRRDIDLAKYGLERSWWLRLTVLVQLIALVGVGTAWWLDRHPLAPDPRLEIYC